MPSSAPRVLLAITQSELGGAQVYVLKLAADLKRRGAEVAIACGEGGPLVSEASALGIDVYVLPYLVRPIRPLIDLQAIVRLSRLIRRGRFNVVHLNSTKAGFVGRLAAIAGGADVVLFTVHGLVLNEPMSKPQFALYWLIERLGAMASSRLIAVSDADRAALIRYRVARPDQIRVIRNGVLAPSAEDGVHFRQRQSTRAQLGIPEDALVVGSVANHYRTKALDVLIKAVPSLIRHCPRAQVVIVGDGVERPSLEALIAQLGVEDRVRLIGAMPAARELMPAFDVFVLPSRKEGLPIALLEAMSAGLPVVVTGVGGVPEVVTAECGHIVPPEDAEALASAIASLLDDPVAAHQYGQAGRQRVSLSFAEQHMLDETVRIYEAELSRVGVVTFPTMAAEAQG